MALLTRVAAVVGDGRRRYTLGSFTEERGFTPTSTEICGANFSGVGNHFDHSGLFYASKSFRAHAPHQTQPPHDGDGGPATGAAGVAGDQGQGQQVLVAWVKEGDAAGFAHPGQRFNLSWAGVLSIPRVITKSAVRAHTRT